MSWILIILFAYFLLALGTLGDRYLLLGPPNPKDYSFYVGMLGILVLLLIPFTGFSLPGLGQFFLALLAGAFFILAIFSFYTALENFEASRVIPAIGALVPIFTLALIFLFSPGKILEARQFIALILLILGSILATFQKGKKISLKSFLISALTAFLLSLTFLSSKFVYLNQPFWSGFILIRVGAFLAALFFFFSKGLREEIFKKKYNFTKKTGLIFVGNQILGGLALILQNWTIALVPLSLLPFINALEGTKYVFLLIIAFLVSSKFPALLKEHFSKEIVGQKILATLLIVIGIFLIV